MNVHHTVTIQNLLSLWILSSYNNHHGGNTDKNQFKNSQKTEQKKNIATTTTNTVHFCTNWVHFVSLNSSIMCEYGARDSPTKMYSFVANKMDKDGLIVVVVVGRDYAALYSVVRVNSIFLILYCSKVDPFSQKVFLFLLFYSYSRFNKRQYKTPYSSSSVVYFIVCIFVAYVRMLATVPIHLHAEFCGLLVRYVCVVDLCTRAHIFVV